jgi:succinate dehydrogenase / fumarate reductase membrane anchor subunit
MSELNRKYQSSLAKARGLGSAREGTHHWLKERILAVAILPLVFWMVYSVLSLRGMGYVEFLDWLALPWNAVLMILFILGTFYHAAMGLQVVIEDYSSSNARKLFSIFAVKIVFFTLGASGVFSILKVAL